MIFNTGWVGCCAVLHGVAVLPLLLSPADSGPQPLQAAALQGGLFSQQCHCCRCCNCCRLHYETPGDKGKPANESKLVTELAALAAWRQQHKAKLPQLVWMDAPVQVHVFAGWLAGWGLIAARARWYWLPLHTPPCTSAHCSWVHAAVTCLCFPCPPLLAAAAFPASCSTFLGPTAPTTVDRSPSSAAPWRPGARGIPWSGQAGGATSRLRQSSRSWRMRTCAPGTTACRCGTPTNPTSAPTGAPPVHTTCGCTS